MRMFYFFAGKQEVIYKVLEQDDGSTHHSRIDKNPANTDYANFKKAINEETAELQDADGNTMTAAEAKEFVATLP